jgi:hypothetical protein
MLRVTLPLCARVALVAVSVAGVSHAAEPSADLRTILERARTYLARYHDQLATVIAEEHYEQQVQANSGVFSMKTRRVLDSEFLLLRTDDVPDGWLGFRDVVRVDGQPVPDRGSRLEELLKSSGGSLSRRARAIAEESARYNVGEVRRTINTPTMALEYLSAANEWRVKTRQRSEHVERGDRVWTVEFEENRSPTIIRGNGGDDVFARGEWWIEASTGRVTHVELRVNRPIRTEIIVSFAHDRRLDLWVPSEMREIYRTSSGLITGEAQYKNYRRFETSGRIVGDRR